MFCTPGVLLLAPLVRPYGWSWLRFYFSLIKHFVNRRPRKFESKGPNQEFLDLLLNDPLQARILPVNWVQAMVSWFERFEKRHVVFEKLIIVQGLKDKTVSSRHNLSVLKNVCRSIRLLEIPKAKHHLVNETEPIRRQLWDWLDITCEWRH
jgi:alpha-beta hydrolase superfamily lysophospholipase